MKNKLWYLLIYILYGKRKAELYFELDDLIGDPNIGDNSKRISLICKEISEIYFKNDDEHYGDFYLRLGKIYKNIDEANNEKFKQM